MNGDVVGVPPGKQRALMTLLALRAPHPVSAESAADALWPRASPAEAMRSLQVTVSRLRRSLGAAGPALETVASGYRLAVEADAIDARRFETLDRSARATRLEGDGAEARRLLDDALALWRGRALADVAFESFAQGEIARLEELRLAALEERIDARLSAGEHPLVVAELEQLAAEYPSRERLVELLMLALYRCGRQSRRAGGLHAQPATAGRGARTRALGAAAAPRRGDPAPRSFARALGEPIRSSQARSPPSLPGSAAAPARDAVRGTDRGAGPARRAARPGAHATGGRSRWWVASRAAARRGWRGSSPSTSSPAGCACSTAPATRRCARPTSRSSRRSSRPSRARADEPEPAPAATRRR